MFNVYTRYRNGQYNKSPYTKCRQCWNLAQQNAIAENAAVSFSISGVEAPTPDFPEETHAEICTLPECSPQQADQMECVVDSPPTEVPFVPTESIQLIAVPQQPTASENDLYDYTPSGTTQCDITIDTSLPSSHPPVTPEQIVHTASVNHDYQPAEISSFNAGRFVLKHHIFENGEWKSHVAQPHPTVSVTVYIDGEDYNNFHIKPPLPLSSNVEAVVDSGAQCCVWGWSECQKAGYRRNDLISVQQKLNGVSKSKLTIYGALLLRLHGTSNSGEYYDAAAVVYISPDIQRFYMSQTVMKQLGIVPSNFPSIGGANSFQIGQIESNKQSDGTCLCIPREKSPGRPSELPMSASEENIPAMKEFLLQRYSTSVFNQCCHQPIPKMSGPPMRIHVDEDAAGTKVTTPGKCPLHWEEKVEKKFNQDVSMGVIEPYPHGQPPKWIHRAHYVRKPDGDVRRVIDLSPLNKHCKREVHGMQSPFELAKGIPAQTWRTVTDAWNGFHSIELHKDDRHLTAFLGPKGKLYQYCVAPQGYASSGDGYNRRCEELFCSFERLRRCMDDNLLYDAPGSLEEHWWRVIDFLECCANNGIILNPKKFQFCQKTVNFAGFHLTESTVEPLPKYLESITHFPTPKSTTDIKAWFGLVNQVAHYAQLRDQLQPFRKFLSPSVPFVWDHSLQQAFEASKQGIIDAIKEGVEIFDVKRKTCLRSDWSKEGIGFYLSQKHCACDGDVPGCCENGWRITLCGSRFLKKSEERYAPIEGEALAVAWALEQTRYFTMGCDDLVVVVDHKPLTKILGDRALDEISNPRIFRIKQRTLPWIYRIMWLPGKNNQFSDATSRYPCDSPSEQEDAEMVISLVEAYFTNDSNITPMSDQHTIASVQRNLNNVTAITWKKLQETTTLELENLLSLIHSGFPSTKTDKLCSELAHFWPFRNCLHVYDGVVLYKNRVVIPPSLQRNVLDSIHAAHQGCSSMNLTAESSVFWPNITNDIQKTRQLCKWCNQNAPSNPKSPPITPTIPTTPFEAVVADYFQFKGWDYLVIADRLSAWTECYHTRSVPGGNKSKGLITLLKHFFGTFGVP